MYYIRINHNIQHIVRQCSLFSFRSKKTKIEAKRRKDTTKGGRLLFIYIIILISKPLEGQRKMFCKNIYGEIEYTVIFSRTNFGEKMLERLQVVTPKTKHMFNPHL